MRRIKSRIRKLGFTLMEVNLAIFIMAGGVMAMVSLYPLGYRESQQSRDDVWAACEADRIFNQLHAALSERTIKWDDWRKTVEGLKGSVGDWKSYCKPGGNSWMLVSKPSINDTAKKAIEGLLKIATIKPTDAKSLDNSRVYAVVVQPCYVRYDGEYQYDYSRVAVSMRISRNAASLFSQPIFFTEIHFQGDQEKM